MQHMIKMIVRNCDGNINEYIYRDIDELKNAWSKDDDPDIPMLDDELIYACVQGQIVAGDTAADVMDYIGDKYNWEY